MTLYSLRLAIHYEFDRPTGAGRQLFRIFPADVPLVQRVLQSSLTITPTPAERGEFTDFFGNRVIEVAMPPGLTSLDLVLTAKVDRFISEDLLDISTLLGKLPGEVSGYPDVGRQSPHHFLAPSRRIPTTPEISAFAAKAVQGCVTARDAVQRLGEALHSHMRFDAKATSVDTLPAEAFALGRGVCQDFSQIMVAGLRSLGLPAAYVAGYLRTYPPPGKKRLAGADAMHAWVRAWAGAEMGWIDYDPTNACFARQDHIDVGYGRDYGDVAPITGMLRLDGSQTGRHSVDIEETPGG